MKRYFIILAILLLQIEGVSAMTAEQRKVLNKGVLYFNTEASASATGDSGCTSATIPSISDTAGVAAAIDSFIVGKGGSGSPFEGLGTSIMNGAVRSGVNPFLVVAIALKESSFGTAGIATEGTNNAFGRTAPGNQPNVVINGRGWYKWASWKASVDGPDDESEFLKEVYIEGFGLTNVKDVIFRYAPPSENNSTLYAQQIDNWMNELVTASGTALDCSNNSGGGQGVEANKDIARELMATKGWSVNTEFECLNNIWTQESGWNEKAINDAENNNDTNRNRILDGSEAISDTEHDAYGIPQSLPGGKMAAIAGDWRTNPRTQITWGLGYIEGRYDTPCEAWAFKQRRGWY